MIVLGVKARDKLTGFEGIAYGRAEYLTGCNQICLVPPAKDNKTGDAQWFDEGRVEVIDSGVAAQKVEGEKPGGPNDAHPKGIR